MATGRFHALWNFIIIVFTCIIIGKCSANDILGCGGFVKSHVNLDFSKIEIGLYTKEGTLKERTECAPTNGYYFIPVYDRGEYILRVHPPAGWSFEPSKVELNVDGISDACSTGQDINFAFNGFGITGRVITAGQTLGPSGISVHLVNDKGETRNTVTENGGDFHFTPVIPGKYTLRATHPRWKIEPSKAEVQVKEGNTDLPAGVLMVKGYEVKGSITSFGSPISGVYVLLYSVEESPKFRVEGCQTALLQGVPDAPICHSITDNNGEFTFGLVPAGDYKLVALSKSPGQNSLVFNLKPDKVDISVKHDSLYIKQAFEVVGLTVSGSVESAGSGVAGVRVLLGGRAVASSDAAGWFTLQDLAPGEYDVSFQHELCRVQPLRLALPGGAAALRGRAAAWRACGRVLALPGAARLRAAAPHHAAAVPLSSDGTWCAYLPPGDYSLTVEPAEPGGGEAAAWSGISRRLTVGGGPVEGVELAAPRSRLSGRVVGGGGAGGVAVRWRQRGGAGGPGGRGGETAVAADGSYTFEDVAWGSIEVSVPTDVFCWEQAAHVLDAAAADARDAAGDARDAAGDARDAAVPDFRRVGYVLQIQTDHDVEVEYSSSDGAWRGVWRVPRGVTSQCVPRAGRVELAPRRACREFSPERVAVAVRADQPLQPVRFRAARRATLLRVVSATPLRDVTLRVSSDHGDATVGPLAAQPSSSGDYHYEHTLYLADGEVAVVSAASDSAVFSPAAPQQVVGAAGPPGPPEPPRGPPEPPCGPPALLLRARPAARRAGRIVPPVEGVTVTLTTEEFELSTTTSSDGAYQFGPVDAALPYAVSASKPSYTFSAPDAAGDIAAHKLAEIHVLLVDDQDNTPLQGGLVSVSGGAYGAAGAAAGGRWAARGLAPGQYHVQPHLQEYRFAPRSTLLQLAAGDTRRLTVRGTRVAWSALGRLASPSGAAWRHVVVAARPAARPDQCSPQEATTDDNGDFRIRGLLPQCEYTLQLKEAADYPGLKLVKAPSSIQVSGRADVRLPRLVALRLWRLTELALRVRAPAALQRSLRVVLAPAGAPPAYALALAAAGAPPPAGLLLAPPRLPADDATYVLTLSSTLSEATHRYKDRVFYFKADGKFKHFDIEFDPKLVSGEQELRQSSLLVVPLLALLAAAAYYRDRVTSLLAGGRVTSLLGGRVTALLAGGRKRRHNDDRTKQ